MSHPCSFPPAKTGSTLSTTSVGVDIAMPTIGRTTVLLWEVSCLKRQSLRLRSAALGLTRDIDHSWRILNEQERYAPRASAGARLSPHPRAGWSYPLKLTLACSRPVRTLLC
jgi:hypothetical protein